MKEQLISIPKRGLKVIAPPETQAHMASIQAYKAGLTTEPPHIRWSADEKTRLKLMRDCGILKHRYPTKTDGEGFMTQVDYQRRKELFEMAYELTNEIVTSWTGVNPNKDIAVVLYGSIAKGLVKKTDHPVPSDIDLVVIGDFTPGEKTKLQNKIQPKREEICTRIFEGCSNVQMWDPDVRYAGAIVQNTEKLTKSNYSTAINYIKSGATALYDPAGIWRKVERDALEAARKKMAEADAPKPKSTRQRLTELFGPDFISFHKQKGLFVSGDHSGVSKIEVTENGASQEFPVNPIVLKYGRRKRTATIFSLSEPIQSSPKELVNRPSLS